MLKYTIERALQSVAVWGETLEPAGSSPLTARSLSAESQATLSRGPLRICSWVDMRGRRIVLVRDALPRDAMEGSDRVLTVRKASEGVLGGGVGELASRGSFDEREATGQSGQLQLPKVS